MKTKNNVFYLLLLLCVCSACGDYRDKNADFFLETVFLDNDERLLNYDAVKDAERIPFFIEEFDDNSSQFPYKVGTYTDKKVRVADGKMTIEYFLNSRYIYSDSIPIEIEKSRNFEVETSLIIYRNDSVSHALSWLYTESEISRGYAITYDQYEDSKKNKIIERVCLYYMTDEWKRIKGYDFNAKDFLNSDEFTILTIRKIENKYAIFINHKLFYILNDKDFIYIPSITTDESIINVFDYFRVYYLP